MRSAEGASNRQLALLHQLDAVPGLVRRGNINLVNRPSVRNPDGTTSSVYSYTFTNPDGTAILLPGVIRNAQGRWFRSNNGNQVWDYYKRTGQHLGIFKTEADADRYANLLHLQQAGMRTTM